MKNLLTKLPALLLSAACALIAFSDASAQANIVILNGDAAGVGFNDTTPATPVGGNTGTTVGQQRLIALQSAASIWGATLTSGPTIVIRSTWQDMSSSCTPTSGTLASAGNNGSIYRFSAGPPGVVPNFWYGVALANALTGIDRNDTAHEINAQFNISLGTPGCFANSGWYYGLDNNHGPNGVDLINVALHEFAHGLGFQTFTSRSTGVQIGDDTNGRFPSIYDRFLFDNSTGKSWPQMTDSERVASAINTGHLVWNGPQVLSDASGASGVLSGTPRLRINSPTAIAGNYQVGTASFGPALSPAGTTAGIVQTIPTNGCSPITNSVAGRIALIDRGDCNFVVKSKNAQDAGASGVVIVDNVSNSTPPGMSGTDPTITIPTVSITLADGNTIKAQLSAAVNGTLLADSSTLAGTDSAGRPMMFAPNPLTAGSSVSHWDSSLLRNQLMEPNIAGDLSQSVRPPQDLTFSLLRDLGWPSSAFGAPTILTEQGTNLVAVLDSVTHVRGPFTATTAHNFSSDGQRRIVFFTTDLGLSGGNLGDLVVRAQGTPLTVDAAGPWRAVSGMSYVVVRLTGLPGGTYPLSVTIRNVNSTNAPTIQIP